MKTAKQMFEELGYEKKEESEGVLLYISDFENSILFDKKSVTITNLYCYGRITININHLLENAIHKQCEELGWLEEEKPYELTQFEYDLIQTYSNYVDYKLSKFNRLIKLKDKGYFKGVDEDTTIHDILANCEVIKDVNG